MGGLKDELDLLKKQVLSENQRKIESMELKDEFDDDMDDVSLDVSEISQENDAKSFKSVYERPGRREAYIVYYKLNGKSNVKKVQFSYALTGRTNQIGILQKLRGKKLGRGCLLVPAVNLDSMSEFFKFWEVEIATQKILLLD